MISISKYQKEIFFLLVLIAVSFYYDYHEISFKRPQSIHKWRQSDCTSIALNYYQDGMNFFYPTTHNFTSDNGKSNKVATSEIPILYFASATLYHIFGYHDYVYRIFNTLLFFLGLFYLFKTLLLFSKSWFWSACLTLLIFTAPVLVFYGNNFLSNSTALAFSIIGWYYFLLYSKNFQNKWFFISMGMFLIAGSLKITALLSVFAISGIYVLEFLGVIQLLQKNTLFRKKTFYLIPIIILLVIVISWVIYANHYNQIHDSTYFSTTTFPIWDLSVAQISSVLESVKVIWLLQYFNPLTIGLLLFCVIILIWKFKLFNPILKWSLLILFIEIGVFIALQFWTFQDHDYYVIGMYIFPIILLISIVDYLHRYHAKLLRSKWLKIAFSLFLIFNINYAHEQIYHRYTGWMNDFESYEDVYDITPSLRELGIKYTDKVIAIPDGSHASLYLMNQYGWTQYTDARFNRGEKTYYNQDSLGIQKSINNGAKYLIVNGIDQLYLQPFLQSFAYHLKGTHKSVLIFDLQSKQKNFTLQPKQILNKVFCNVDSLSKDTESFIGNGGEAFGFGSTQSDEQAYEGKYSSKLNAKASFGINHRFTNVKEGESFTITVWRKGNPKASIIASSTDNTLYLSSTKIIHKEPNNWEQIELSFFVDKKIEGQEIVCYVYNPDDESAYFDNMQITRYQTVLE